MKKLALILFIILGIMPVSAYSIDVSVNDEIQKKYDADKLNQDVQTKNADDIIKVKTTNYANVSKSSDVPSTAPQFDNEKPTVSADNSKYKRNGIRIPRWTKFNVRSNQQISNWNGANSTISFKTTAPVYKKFVTIQTGTTFTGKITKIHSPQISGNGALIEIKIDSMTYNGQTIPVEGKITKANSELVFFNKIKGDRQYLNGVEKKIKSANNFYAKSRSMSNKLSKNPIGTVISPIPTVVGFVGATAATVASPFTGLLEKGKNISFPAGTTFEIKLLSDVFLN